MPNAQLFMRSRYSWGVLAAAALIANTLLATAAWFIVALIQ
jgi:hypothetical protein